MKKINVVEIGPRDGFQSISCMQIPTETKKEINDAGNSKSAEEREAGAGSRHV